MSSVVLPKNHISWKDRGAGSGLIPSSNIASRFLALPTETDTALARAAVESEVAVAVSMLLAGLDVGWTVVGWGGSCPVTFQSCLLLLSYWIWKMNSGWWAA